MDNVKTANQLWRESGRRVPFKDFLEEQKRKAEYFQADGVNATFMLNKPVNDSIQKTLTEMQKKGAGIRPDLTKKNILGVPKVWFWAGTALVVGALGYYFWTRKKS